MSLGCARCGHCCEMAYINVSRDELAARDDEDALFIMLHWTQNDDGVSYHCDMLDSESRLCTAYENRPPVCANYPWYGDEPSKARSWYLSEQCSYLLDVQPEDRPEGSRPLIPLTVL